MEYLSFDPVNKTLSLKKAKVPTPNPNEVCVKVAYAGVCGTDLHILEGAFPCKTEGSLTLGHEFSGTIISIGSEVKHFKVGQRVVVDPNSGCNNCDCCHSGTYQFCSTGGLNTTIGIYKNGGWATHALVPESQIYVVPNDVELHQAALTEPLSCLAHGWDKINPVNVGLNVLVIGAGIIGLLWTSLLHLRGLRKTVTVSEPQEKRRLMVPNLGNHTTLNPIETIPWRNIYNNDLDYDVKSPDQLKPEYDLIVDCSGSGPAMQAAVPLLRSGGRLCVFGVSSPQTKFTIEPYQIFKKELSIVGVNINPFTFPEGVALLRAMASKYLDFNKLGIKVYALSQYHEALEALKSGEISKAIFKM